MLLFLKFPKAYIGDLVRKYVPSICECVQRRKPSREEASVCSKVSLISHFIVEPSSNQGRCHFSTPCGRSNSLACPGRRAGLKLPADKWPFLRPLPNHQPTGSGFLGRIYKFLAHFCREWVVLRNTYHKQLAEVVLRFAAQFHGRKGKVIIILWGFPGSGGRRSFHNLFVASNLEPSVGVNFAIVYSTKNVTVIETARLNLAMNVFCCFKKT